MRTIQISDEDYEFLKELQHELNTQENDGEAEPIYWGVMEHKMVPAPEGCGDPIIYMGDGATMTTEQAVEYVNENICDYSEELQEQWKDVNKNWMDDVATFIHDEMDISECRVVWEEEKAFISHETGAFITKRACKEYIRKCHYNHSKPHTYAMTAYRNFELERLLKILRSGLDFQDPKKVWHPIDEKLKESEDERIRIALYLFVETYGAHANYEVTREEMLAWLKAQCEHANFRNKIQIGDKVTRNQDGVLVNLSQLKRVAKKDEKQGEQKATEWSSEQSKTLQTDDVPNDSSTAPLRTGAIGFDGEPMESKPCEQKSDWSKEDEQYLLVCKNALAKYQITNKWDARIISCWLEDKLKSLRPQSQWKPSNEQMENLSRAFNGGTFQTSLLMELYQDLKKLKE